MLNCVAPPRVKDRAVPGLLQESVHHFSSVINTIVKCRAFAYMPLLAINIRGGESSVGSSKSEQQLDTVTPTSP